MDKVAQLKHRPIDQPFIFLIPDTHYLEENGIPLPESGKRLATRFWPGPLTLILSVPPGSALSRIAFRESLAVRVSPHPFVQTLLRHRRFPLVSTSANLSGAPEDGARNPQLIIQTFGEFVDYFVTEGPRSQTPSPSSTIVDVRSAFPKIVREGAVSAELLSDFT